MLAARSTGDRDGPKNQVGGAGTIPAHLANTCGTQGGDAAKKRVSTHTCCTPVFQPT